ncbi:molybdenum ABC transporter ATP-binding protein [Marivita sp. XM-24bin2]|uniref:molybdenum ABC transporter ATP-binding protein n=1 Tax=unclassified Marivita TaxID=2632480 RepID=UPI000D79BAF5|nr:molybdenum ABC transporter ATP-binding protein [Marivita sp. XM-24bin2]MCR9110543.1 molybdenum ABC transporter ATP-binding protein [Paracoccaceae bacterium]PWL37227.1 MAG: molybdenum ABC transporter ATP-binding protein [Marivita sp. XM-24bin2]
MSLSVDIRRSLGGFDLHTTFDAPEGVTVLFGRSGSGKTSVVKSVAGLVTPQQGKITVNGRVLFDRETHTDLPVHKRRLGYVFQDSRLFPHLSVRDNLCYAARVSSRGATDPRQVGDLLGISHLLDRRPHSLSGGEAQRVAIGRALLSAPDMLLMDEPLASLDGPRKAEILPYLETLRRETGLSILYVTHNMAEVARLATHIVLIDEGRVVRSGAPEEVLTDPDMVRLLGIRDAGAVLSAIVAEHLPDGLSALAISAGKLFLPAVDAPVGAKLRVRILAQDVILARSRPEGLSALNILPVRVLAVRRGEGPGVIVQLQAGEDRLLARITRRSADALGIVEGADCFAVMKSVAVSQTDIAVGLQTGL